MMLSYLLTAALWSTAGAVPPAPPCPGTTTPEVEACLGERLHRDEAQFDSYSEAARRRLRADGTRDLQPARATAEVAAFDKAQVAWSTYRDLECGAVFNHWRDGTIRGAMSVSCAIEQTRLRTHTVWRDWLTFADTTPPVLPEPAR